MYYKYDDPGFTFEARAAFFTNSEKEWEQIIIKQEIFTPEEYQIYQRIKKEYWAERGKATNRMRKKFYARLEQMPAEQKNFVRSNEAAALHEWIKLDKEVSKERIDRHIKYDSKLRDSISIYSYKQYYSALRKFLNKHFKKQAYFSIQDYAYF